VQGLHLALLIHAQHDRLVRRVQVQPHHVADLCLQLGVGGELESLRSPRLQTPLLPGRDTVKSLTPRCLASSRLDQCVTPSCSGGGSNVARTIVIGSIVGGRPDLGRSSSPARPSLAYRRFHLITAGLLTPTRCTISPVPTPSAASNTIRALCANPARSDGDRSQPSKT